MLYISQKSHPNIKHLLAMVSKMSPVLREPWFLDCIYNMNRGWDWCPFWTPYCIPANLWWVSIVSSEKRQPKHDQMGKKAIFFESYIILILLLAYLVIIIKICWLDMSSSQKGLQCLQFLLCCFSFQLDYTTFIESVWKINFIFLLFY